MKSYLLTVTNAETEAELEAFLVQHPDIIVERWDSGPDAQPENDPEFMAGLQLAIEQAERGEVITLDELKMKMEEWKSRQE